MPKKLLFNTKQATGSVGKSGSAADASVSSPEANKPSSASVTPSTGAEILAGVPDERRSSPLPAYTLKLAIPHGCSSNSLPGDSNNRALQVGMDSTNLIVNSGSLSRAVSNTG